MGDDEIRGAIRTSDPQIMREWHSICDQMESKRQAWVASLRADGVKMAHPDDGWVDRNRNVLTPCYPQFDDNPMVGDLVALGWPDGYRIVRVVDINEWGVIEPGRRYRFEMLSEVK